MKFSVLLPTRNRLDLLKYAVETVRRQDYDDWQIVISDNFSDDDIGGYVGSLQEPRIRYRRTQRLVPVTQSWNNALERYTGDYVVMLGNDDGLMKGYFSRKVHEHPGRVRTTGSERAPAQLAMGMVSPDSRGGLSAKRKTCCETPTS